VVNLAAMPVVLVLVSSVRVPSDIMRGCGAVPVQAVDWQFAGVQNAAMSARELRVREPSAIAVPLTEGPTAPVWGVMVLLGENLKPREVLTRVAAAGAVILNRLED
jgi:hypothetical protein